VAVLVAAGFAAVGRLPVAVVVKVGTIKAATAATLAVEVAAVVAGVGRFIAAIVVDLDGKATSAFPDKSIQNLFASVRVDRRRAKPSTLARYAMERGFWMVRRRGRSLFVSR
jgi:hypothetical protein